MTFDEVPIGHVFKWLATAGQIGCDCLVRRTGETSYVYVWRCPEHVGAIATGGTATMSDVRYDPFIAMVEALRDSCE